MKAVSSSRSVPRTKHEPAKPLRASSSQRKRASHSAVRRYRTGADPAVGFNLVSWWNFGEDGPAVWQAAVQDLFDHGFRHVTFVPLRFVDPETWDLPAREDPRLAQVSHVEAGLVRAEKLGMTTAVNPLLEVRDFGRWRGELEPEDRKVNRFFGDYTDYVDSIAQIAEAHGVNRLTVGSELKFLVRNPGFHNHWKFLIDAARGSFSGLLGYAANWDSYDDVNLTEAVWSHPGIDFMGIDAYFPLATEAQADASGPYPDEHFISVIQDNWATILGRLLDFAASLRRDKALPVVFTEHGLVPYHRCTVAPSRMPLHPKLPCPDEQASAYDALLRATRGMGSRLHEITFWHWGMPGSDRSEWSTHPKAVSFLADFVARSERSD